MRILHTSDWHLGRTLYGRKRYAEFEAFLEWLSETIQQHQIDTLLVAGDVFDTSTPSNHAQALYYRFLCRVACSACRHVVVIAGNHDSATFLNAPKALLQALHIHVVGAATDCLDDEIITLRDGEQRPQAIICAVPYLRDRDIRTVAAGESIDDKNSKLIEGLKDHYLRVCAIAEQMQAHFHAEGEPNVPIVAMGHLFTAGGQTVDGDGVRELYVGSLAHIGADQFPPSIQYLALGHLHSCQCVGGRDHIRYCGSPIAMGYGELKADKKVIIVTFHGNTPTIKEVTVPCFQPLEQIIGSWDEIEAKLAHLKQQQSRAWLEIEYHGNAMIANLQDRINGVLAGSNLEVLRVKNRRVINQITDTIASNTTLDDLNADDVFVRCLDTFDIPAEDRSELMRSYKEIIQSLHEEDRNAE
ncbi:MAG: exonuclease SbcCD subunit D C-terminal domain-containing protein [Mariprofundales bacterium]